MNGSVVIPILKRSPAACNFTHCKGDKFVRQRWAHYLRSCVCLGCGGRESHISSLCKIPPTTPLHNDVQNNCRTQQPWMAASSSPSWKEVLLLAILHTAKEIKGYIFFIFGFCLCVYFGLPSSPSHLFCSHNTFDFLKFIYFLIFYYLDTLLCQPHVWPMLCCCKFWNIAFFHRIGTS